MDLKNKNIKKYMVLYANMLRLSFKLKVLE